MNFGSKITLTKKKEEKLRKSKEKERQVDEKIGSVETFHDVEVI